MCRSRQQSGRRCPCDLSPSHRAAKRKARRAARAATGVSTQGQNITTARPDSFDPDQIAALAERIRDSYTDTPAGTAAAAGLVREHGSRVGALIAVGNAIRTEGERRSGVDLDAARATLTEEGTAVERAYLAVEERLTSVRAKVRAVMDTATGSFAERKAAVAAVRSEHEAAMGAVEDDRRAVLGRHHALQQQMNTVRTGLADGYLSALSDVRELGGRELAFNQRTSKKAREAFQEASRLYPTEWLDAANNLPAPYAAVTASRAHYNRGVRKTISTRGQDTATATVQTDDVEAYCRENSHAEEQYERDTEREVSGETLLPGYAFVKITRYEVHRDFWRSGGRPKGRGWQRYDDESVDYAVWRRPKIRATQQGAEAVAELRTNELKQQHVDGVSSTYAVSAHELAHRMEHAVPQIAQMEHDFLVHRTTGADGQRDETTSIYANRKGSRDERGYSDSFALHYSGRVYGDEPGHDQGQHYELLSTGMESLFAGRHGAQVGLGSTPNQYTNDDEYRAFVLGVLATAHPSEQVL